MNGSDSNVKNDQQPNEKGTSSPRTRRFLGWSAASALLLWLSQPPFAIWPVATIALVPWLFVISWPTRMTRREGAAIWLVATIYWLVTLQGLRNAHPVMYVSWMALSAYLAVYPLLFVLITRRLVRRRVPLVLSAPIAWVGCECVRNYFLSGISAAMLGHTMADVPDMIQIADLFGTYGVSWLLVTVNVAVFLLVQAVRGQAKWKAAIPSAVVASLLVIATVGYGRVRRGEPLEDSLATFALIQRSEVVEYVQDLARETEMFQNYALETLEALRGSQQPVNAIVWPESMYTGGSPWWIAEKDAVLPVEEVEFTREEFELAIKQRQDIFVDRSRYMQVNLATVNGTPPKPPHLIVGCGVVRYHERKDMHSGVVHVDGKGNVADWYGKTHLVLIGEYVPIIPSLPVIGNLVPESLTLKPGPGPIALDVDGTRVSPSICIETAVERVTVNQIAELRQRGEMPDVVVNVTNDGWFDQSSVIDHHLRSGQLVAVACRRPILSAANNGPTAWIDSYGQLVERLPTGSSGNIIAKPLKDQRTSLYVLIGDWPARIVALIAMIALVLPSKPRESTDND